MDGVRRAGARRVPGARAEGAFTVVASAPGYQDATGQVTVGADECHVIGESMELVLEATGT